MKRARKPYMRIVWRGALSRRARIYQGTRRKEFFPVRLTADDPWCGSMTFTVTWRGRRDYRARSVKPRHVRRLEIA